MSGAIKAFFAITAALLYGVSAVLVALGAHSTAGFEPNAFQTDLLKTGAGALIAFISAQLGLAAAKSEEPTFASSVRSTMGSKKGAILLLVDVAVFTVVGLWFVLLASKPDLIAVAPDADALKDAPEYITSHAKLFIGVVFAAVAAIAPSATR